jgi:hypothetical protein
VPLSYWLRLAAMRRSLTPCCSMFYSVRRLAPGLLAVDRMPRSERLDRPLPSFPAAASPFGHFPVEYLPRHHDAVTGYTAFDRHTAPTTARDDVSAIRQVIQPARHPQVRRATSQESGQSARQPLTEVGLHRSSGLFPSAALVFGQGKMGNRSKSGGTAIYA